MTLEEQTHSGEIGNDSRITSNGNVTAASDTTTATSTGDSRCCDQHVIQSGTPEDDGDLSPFVVVPRNDRHNDDHLGRYDADIDIPRPRTHSEVVRYRAAKSAAGRWRAELDSSEVGNERLVLQNMPMCVCHTHSHR